MAAPDRLPHGRRSTPPRTRTARRSPSWSTARPIFVRGANWIPDDCFPTRVDRDALRAPHRPGRRRQHRTCCASGAAGSTRARTSTTICDERGLLVWQDFLFACAAYPEEEPLRSEVSAEARENVARLAAAPEPGALERRQREHLGLRGLGLAGASSAAAPGARATTASCCPRSWPSSTRPGPTAPGSPCSAHADAPPQRPRPRHHAHLGRLERARLHRLPRLRPAVRVGVRLPGPAGLVDPDPRRARRPAATRLARRCCCTRRPRTATPSSTRGWRRTSACPADIDDWHWATSAEPGQGRRLRRGALPLLGAATAAARSCGSSTTAGR